MIQTVAGYGLSAFLYASISALLIGDNTELFLLVLAIGTFASLFGAGILLTNTRMETAYSLIPGGSPLQPERALLRHSRRRSSASGGTAGERDLSDDEEEMDDLSHDDGVAGVAEYNEVDTTITRGRTARSNSNGSSLLAPSSSINTPNRPGGNHKKQSSILVKQAGEAITRIKQDNILVETGALGLFKVPDYYLLMIVAFCCTGTGIMWINSVGTVVGESSNHPFFRLALWGRKSERKGLIINLF